MPLEGDEEAQEEVNRFLRAHRVLSVKKVAVIANGRHSWSLCVEYLPKRSEASPSSGKDAASDAARPRIDYREVLSTPEFERFCHAS